MARQEINTKFGYDSITTVFGMLGYLSLFVKFTSEAKTSPQIDDYWDKSQYVLTGIYIYLVFNI